MPSEPEKNQDANEKDSGPWSALLLLLLLNWLKNIGPGGGGGDEFFEPEGDKGDAPPTEKEETRKESPEESEEGEEPGPTLPDFLKITERKNPVTGFPHANLTLKRIADPFGDPGHMFILQKRIYGPIFQRPQVISSLQIEKYRESDAEQAKFVKALNVLRAANGTVMIIKHEAIKTGPLNHIRGLLKSTGSFYSEMWSSPMGPETKWLKEWGIGG